MKGQYQLLLATALVLLISQVNCAPVPEEQLTPDHKNALETFRQKVSSKLPEDWMKMDFYLLKWLEAKDWNLQEADKMLTDSLAWRKKNKMSTILSEDFSDISDRLPINIESVDKNGHPVGIAVIGDWKIRELIKSGKQKRVVRYVEYFQEKVIQQIVDAQKAGKKEIAKGVILADFTGFSTSEHMCPTCAPIMLKFIQGMQTNYPGFIEEAIIINAPKAFTDALETAKNMLPADTLALAKIFDEDKSKWEVYLKEKISDEQLPAKYGGSKQ